MIEPALPAAAVPPGILIARGVARHLRGHGFVSLPEMPLPSGLRADLLALGPKGEIWIVECKSSRADYRADAKWTGYLEWGDRFFWAVGADFPRDILPPDSGLILADGYGAGIMRMPDASPLAAARRRAVTVRFARLAAARLQAFIDPGAGAVDG